MPDSSRDGNGVEPGAATSPRLSPRAKTFLLVIILLIAVALLWEIRQIITPFLWAMVAAYLLSPIVNYLNVKGGLPRLWAVILIYATIALGLVAVSRYLYPRVVDQVNLFLEDIPRIESSLIDLVGPRPLGINIDSVIRELANGVSSYTSNAKNASVLVVNAVETFFKIFLFLISTFYLLMDGPRLVGRIKDGIPPAFRPELVALGRQIHLTWQQYIRGELLLFVLMATVISVGLTILQVPGAIFIGIVSGVLELLPLVGPWTAAVIGVSVAYFSGTNPWNFDQLAYAGIVAAMYFVLRQAEDYFVMPQVIGRAVRLPPLIVLFSLTCGGFVAGLFGLIIAVPVAASLKAIGAYLYAKLLDQPVTFEPVRTLGGGVIEIPIHAPVERPSEGGVAESPGAP